MTRIKNIAGERYGKCVVIEFSHQEQKPHCRAFWKCQCDCGKTFTTRSNWLRTGAITSCGCKRRSANGKSQSDNRRYQQWKKIKQEWPLHEHWQNFDNFAKDIGAISWYKSIMPKDWWIPIGPDNYHICHLKEYSIEVNGFKKSITEWAKDLGTSRQTVWARIHESGWSEKKAVTTPVHKKSVALSK